MFGRHVFPLVLGASTLAGCTTLASSPLWVGGTLADGAPERIEEVALKKETELILSERAC